MRQLLRTSPKRKVVGSSPTCAVCRAVAQLVRAEIIPVSIILGHLFDR